MTEQIERIAIRAEAQRQAEGWNSEPLGVEEELEDAGDNGTIDDLEDCDDGVYFEVEG
jgi:hypothetical protein